MTTGYTLNRVDFTPAEDAGVPDNIIE